MPTRIADQLFLTTDWLTSRPEFIRRHAELAKSLNPIADGFQLNSRTVTAANTMVSADGVILADATGGAFTIVALAADAATAKMIRIKKIDAGANKVYIKPAGSDTIEGATLLTLAAQYESLTIFSSGASKWWRF